MPMPDQDDGQRRVGRGLAADADRLAVLLRPAAAVVAISWRTAGCHGSVRWARSVAIRSAAMAYCVRSLVPIDRKSTTSRIRSASSAAEGISTMTPGLQPVGAHLGGERVGLGDGGHHRRHHPRRGAGLLRRPARCPRSAGRAARVAEGQPQPADAEGGVLLAGRGRVGDRLVGAGVEGADDDGASCRPWPRAPRRRRRPARRPTAPRCGPGSTARCGTARRPRPGQATAVRGRRAVGDVGQHLHRGAVRGRGGPGPRVQRLAPGPVRLDALRRRRPRPGRRSTVAGRCRRRARGCPSARSVAPPTPTTQGMPSWRAMIAVWLVGPALLGDQGDDARRGRGRRCRPAPGPRRRAPTARRACSARARGRPTIRAVSRRSMSCRSVTRSAISPPICVKRVVNCSTAPCSDRQQRLARR